MNAKEIGSLLPNSGRALSAGIIAPYSTIIANSEVIVVGDAVKTSSGFVAASSVTTAAVLGIVVAVVDSNGLPINPDAGTADTFTVASDNQTNAKKYAIVDESPFTIYSFKANAAPGVTTGSNLRGYYADFADHSQLSESSAATTGKVIRLLGVDPADTTRILGNINKAECYRN